MASRSMIIAPRTACSASSDQGGLRSRKTSRVASVEDSLSELDVIPGWPLPARVSQQRGRMISHHKRHAKVSVNPATQLANAFACVQERLRGERSERENHLWLNE